MDWKRGAATSPLSLCARDSSVRTDSQFSPRDSWIDNDVVAIGTIEPALICVRAR